MSIPLPLSFLWAKLGNETWPEKYHPLICHLIDVAYVTRGLWDHVFRPRVKAWVTIRLNLSSEDEAGAWLAFWAGAHDIGKACAGFQDQGDHRTAQLKDKLPTLPWVGLAGKTPPHGDLSTAILATELELDADYGRLPRPVAQRIAVAVGGHHGLFCPDWNNKKGALAGGSWLDVRRELLAELAREAGISGRAAPTPAGDESDNPVWMYLAGLTSVADWIGSNQKFFPPYGNADRAADGFSIDDYSQQAKVQAYAALDALGWLGHVNDPTHRTFRNVFPEISTPRPLQEEIERIAGAMTEPTLVIVEAPMGEGKTEAAWYVADRWDRLGGQGCYVALPTMATSNQMFDRVKGFLEKRAGKSNVQLLHGKAQLNETFEALKYKAYVYDEDKRPTAVVAEGWFAANKKHGLLAPFGVGTIDQSLLAVLQTKHVFVRLFGLAGKCVILDEVHAYDAYMTTLLERLLQWLAALGCPVVLLSATLPADRRLRLLHAYAGNETPAPDKWEYPRITTAASGREPTTVPVEADKARARTVALRWVSDDGLTDQLADALEHGGCACVIRNTVGLAQETYLRLKKRLPPDVTVELFHARFPRVLTDAPGEFGGRSRPRGAS
jgi:CRISPR-associated endonuclease/helicase Cas3